jgi:hypothetical protein
MSVKLDTIRRNTETITFRLDKETLDKIRNVAKREKTSPNGLVNNILAHKTCDGLLYFSGTKWVTTTIAN